MVAMDARLTIATEEREVLLPRGSRFRSRGVRQVSELGRTTDIVDVDYVLPDPVPGARVPKRVKRVRPLARRAVSDDVFDGYAAGKKAEKALAAPVQLSEDALDGVMAYHTDDDGDINREWRTVAYPSSRIHQITRFLDEAIETAPAVKKPTVVWRGVDKKWVPADGTVFRDRGYVSTSADGQMATAFGEDAVGTTVMRIGLPKGQRGVYLPALKDVPRSGSFQKEKEWLLPRGTRFRVLGRRQLTAEEFTTQHGVALGTVPPDYKVTVVDVEIVK